MPVVLFPRHNTRLYLDDKERGRQYPVRSKIYKNIVINFVRWWQVAIKLKKSSKTKKLLHVQFILSDF